MNAQYHSLLSAKNRGGKPEDYYQLHDFSDVSKEVVSDQRFRIYGHNMWSIKNYLVPIFGHTIINSDNKSVNVKDMLEHDHVACDFRGYIPNLTSYVELINDSFNPNMFRDFYDKHFEEIEFYKLQSLIYSPFSITGQVKSLIITHNDWFWNTIVRRITKTRLQLEDSLFPVSMLFDNMRYDRWLSGEVKSKKSLTIAG